jgi:hypothetical protein
LKIPQLILSLIGLGAIILAYVTGKLDYLIIAVAAFVGGLYYMGGFGKRAVKSNTKDKSQKQQ